MISYTFSKREKALLLGLAIVLVAIAWYVLVYQRTTDEINRAQSQISVIQTQVAQESARVAQMNQMKSEIEESKAAGVTPVPIPAYDNLRPLMDELNDILRMADTYSLTFDDVADPTDGYVRRGVVVVYSCGSYDAAEAVVNALANGKYPCSIDSISIVDGTTRSSGRTGTSSSAVSASAHVTFFEK